MEDGWKMEAEDGYSTKKQKSNVRKVNRKKKHLEENIFWGGRIVYMQKKNGWDKKLGS